MEQGQANHLPASFSLRRPSCGGLRESPTCILQLAVGFAPLPAPRPGRAPAATAGAGSRPRRDAEAAQRGPFPAPPGHKEREAWGGGRTRPQAHSSCRGPALGGEEGAFLLLFPQRRDKGGAGGLRSPARGSRRGRLRCPAAPGPASPRALGVEPGRPQAPGEAGGGAARLKVTLAASPAPRPPPSSSSSPGTCRRCRRPAPADPLPCPFPRHPTGRPARRWPCCRGGGRHTRRWGCQGRRAPPWLALPAPAPLQTHAAARGGRSAPPASASSFPSPPGGRAVPPLSRPGAAAYRPDLPRCSPPARPLPSAGARRPFAWKIGAVTAAPGTSFPYGSPTKPRSPELRYPARRAASPRRGAVGSRARSILGRVVPAGRTCGRTAPWRLPRAAPRRREAEGQGGGGHGGRAGMAGAGWGLYLAAVAGGRQGADAVPVPQSWLWLP